VLVDVRQHAEGRTSGLEGDLDFFVLYTFRGKKIVRIESILDPAEALEAAGLSG
jgi:ketosteroid isomerase-like protein